MGRSWVMDMPRYLESSELTEVGEEVITMLAAGVLDAEVVDDESEGDGTGGMLEEACRVGS